MIFSQIFSDKFTQHVNNNNNWKVKPILSRPVLNHVVQEAEIEFRLVDDCSVKLG